MRRLIPAVLALALIGSSATSADAQAVRSGFASTPMNIGDDLYQPSDYGFDINYYGFHSDAGIVCTNGYMILNYFAPSTPACAYPAATSTAPSTPNLSGLRDFYGSVMAPYFADFNPEAPGSGGINIGYGLVGGNQAWSATWEGVLGYGGFSSVKSYFQLALIKLNDDGDFIMEYNYDHMAAGSDGGVGYTVDDLGIAQFAAAGVIEPDGTRISCTFIDGLPDCTSAIVTPEPATLVLTATGFVAIVGVGYRRRRNASATI